MKTARILPVRIPYIRNPVTFITSEVRDTMKAPRRKPAPTNGRAAGEDEAAPATPRRARRKRPAAEDLMLPTDTASADVIAERAHQLFLSRGGVHGYDLDDWLEAERQVSRGPAREN